MQASACTFFMMKRLLILLLLNSCSYLGLKSGNVSRVNLGDYQSFSAEDYKDHLKSFEQVYVKAQKKKMIPQSSRSQRYLSSIVEKVVSNNELFFLDDTQPTFHIVKSKVPFHFSLPGRKIFLSSQLLNKYITNETMLYCVIVFELIRSEKNLYKKNIIIPTGVMETKRALSLLRLGTKEKSEVHKWAFYILKRVGVETDGYLSWLQVINRNSLDFILQIGDVQSMSREEALFKSFLIEEVNTNKNKLEFRSSSRDFYSFIKNVKG